MLTTVIAAAVAVVAAVAAAACPAYGAVAAGPPAVTLNDKVAHAHWRYRDSGKVLSIRVNERDGVMRRREWERRLRPTNATLALTAADVRALAARQAAQVAAAAAKARRESVIDLDAIRGDEARVAAFCDAMPRAAILHIHPSGTRNLTTIQEMLAELDPLVNSTAIIKDANDGELTTLYPSEVTALEALPVQRYSQFDFASKGLIEELFFLPTSPPDHPFTRFEALFSIANTLLEQDDSKDVYVDEKTYLDFARRAVRLGLSYAEFTKVKIPPTRKALDRFGELKALIKAETNLTANFVYAFVRTIEPTSLNQGWSRELVDLTKEQEEGSSRGIDLLGNELNFPALETGQGAYLPVFAARRDGDIRLKSTMHAGELGDPRNVRDAMIMGVQRIGHGVLLREDPVALEYARLNGVGIVCSLVSNRLLRVESEYSNHPFLTFLRLGVPTSLSTDDEGMFRTDIANECRIAVTNTDIQYSEMVALSRNAVLESFAGEKTKAQLLATLEGELKDFEASFNATV